MVTGWDLPLTHPGAFTDAVLSSTDRLGHSGLRLPYTQEVRGPLSG